MPGAPAPPAIELTNAPYEIFVGIGNVDGTVESTLVMQDILRGPTFRNHYEIGVYNGYAGRVQPRYKEDHLLTGPLGVSRDVSLMNAINALWTLAQNSNKEWFLFLSGQVVVYDEDWINDPIAAMVATPTKVLSTSENGYPATDPGTMVENLAEDYFIVNIEWCKRTAFLPIDYNRDFVHVVAMSLGNCLRRVIGASVSARNAVLERMDGMEPGRYSYVDTSNEDSNRYQRTSDGISFTPFPAKLAAYLAAENYPASPDQKWCRKIVNANNPAAFVDTGTEQFPTTNPASAYSVNTVPVSDYAHPLET